MSQITNNKSVPAKLPVVNKDVETTFGDRLLETIKPHTNLIMLGAVALFLLFIAIAWMFQSRARVVEGEWLSLNQALAVANMTGSAGTIKEVAEEYPDGVAGLWGLQMAGDFELRQGLQEIAKNRTEGMRTLEKARNTLKKVVEAPNSRKSTMLQVRSTFSLAYAHESLGEFDEARKLYQMLVEQAPESAFGQAAERGLSRCNDPGFAAVYDRFKQWEDPFAVAPGEPTTEKPDISFPDISETDNPPNNDPSNSETAPGNQANPDNSDTAPAGNPDGGASTSPGDGKGND